MIGRMEFAAQKRRHMGITPQRTRGRGPEHPGQSRFRRPVLDDAAQEERAVGLPHGDGERIGVLIAQPADPVRIAPTGACDKVKPQIGVDAEYRGEFARIRTIVKIIARITVRDVVGVILRTFVRIATKRHGETGEACDKRAGKDRDLKALPEAELAHRERDELARVGIRHLHVHIRKQDGKLGRRIRVLRALALRVRHCWTSPSMMRAAAPPCGSMIETVRPICCSESRDFSASSPVGAIEQSGA